jgi:hypothetical protein
MPDLVLDLEVELTEFDVHLAQCVAREHSAFASGEPFPKVENRKVILILCYTY